jgi:ATP/maltotriose-dependent transcriptional regulator MalT
LAAVPRDRLVARLTGIAAARLTLIVAPAGWGKTTLMAQCGERLGEAGAQVAWAALTPEHAAPADFLNLLLAALDAAAPTIGATARRFAARPEGATLDWLVDALIADLRTLPQPLDLLLDDYHFAEGPENNALIERLTDRALDRFRLWLTARRDPALPLARMRVAGLIQRVGPELLALDADEAATLLTGLSGDAPDPAARDQLLSHSEGWPAALQLAGLARQTAASWDEVLTAFGSNMRDVSEYLAAEVFRSLPFELKDFLVKTAVLDRFTAPLCALLTGDSDAADRLRELEERHLFVVPLDDQRQWHRYHHLFQAYLLEELMRREDIDPARLYRLASDWSAAAGMAPEAVSYALKGGAADRAAELIEAHALDMLKTGQMRRMYDWTLKLPPSEVARRPRLLLLRCWALFHLRRPREAATALAQAEAALAGDPGDQGVELHLLRAGIAMAEDDVAAVRRLRRALPVELCQLSHWFRGTLANIFGYAEISLGDFAAGEVLLRQAQLAHMAGGSAFGQVYANCFLGLGSLFQADLNRAVALFDEAEQWAAAAAGANAPGAAVVRVMQGAVAYERGELDRALALVEANAPLLAGICHVELEIWGYLTLARTRAALGDCDGHARAMAQADAAVAAGVHQRQRIRLVGERISRALAQGDLPTARWLADEAGIGDPAPAEDEDAWDRVRFCRAYLRTRLYLAEAHAAEAAGLAAMLTARATREGRMGWAMSSIIVEAQARWQAGESDAAIERLGQALAIARPGGHLRTFSDFGTSLQPLLRRAIGQQGAVLGGANQAWAMRILETLEPPAVRTAKVSRTLAQFSGRELDVLRLLAEGRPNHAIASELMVAENTVKWHLKNIFDKLGVHTRSAAVARYLAEQQTLPT